MESGFLAEKMDGVIREVAALRKRYLAYKYIVLSDRGQVVVIPVKHGDLPLRVRQSLGTLVHEAITPAVRQKIPTANLDEITALVILNLVQFMAATMQEKNPRIVHMAMYTRLLLKAFKPTVVDPDIYILAVESQMVLNIFASSFDGKTVEHLF